MKSSLALSLVSFGSLAGIAASPLPARSAEIAADVPRTRNVAIVIHDGVELLDFAGPGEVFAAAANVGALRGKPAFRVYTVAPKKDPIVSQGFLKVVPDFSLDDAPAPDVLIVPGGDSGVLTRDAKFMAWASQAFAKNELTLSVCSGAFVLAQAGILDGKTATTWYGAIDRLRKLAPRANVQEGRRLVDQGSFVTTAGVSAGIDGALHVVARLLGRAVADRTARYMEYHWAPEPYLAKDYSELTPGLDEESRALQAASLLDGNDRAEAARIYRRILEQAPHDGYVWLQLSLALASGNDLAGAIEAGKKAAALPESRVEALYDLACWETRTGAREDALSSLESLVAAGFHSREQLQNDDELAPLREDPRFQKLLARL